MYYTDADKKYLHLSYDLIMVFFLFLFGVASVREFALPLMAGIICGAYSSVCITGALWYVMKTKVGKKKEVVKTETGKKK